MQPLLIVDGLKKTYPNFKLNGVSFAVYEDCITGFIGANGAGKTTILRLLAGVLIPDRGKILIDETPVFDNEELKQRISLVSDDLYFPAGTSLFDMGKFYQDI